MSELEDYKPEMLPGFTEPYGVLALDELASWDFNREIVPPGTSEYLPDGAVGVRVDCDFWTVAILPYEEYINVSIEDIVAKFWPEITGATFYPDSGSTQ